LRLAVYRQSVRLGAKPLEADDQNIFIFIPNNTTSLQYKQRGHTPTDAENGTTGKRSTVRINKAHHI
jgi:hypothetical protein